MTDFRQNRHSEHAAPEHFKAILRDGEFIEWVGAPDKATYMRQGYIFLGFGLVWGLLDLGFITAFTGGGMPGGMGFFLVPFFLLHLFPFWGSILNMYRLARNASRMRYAYTSERILISNGFWAKGVRSIYYDSIINLSLDGGSGNKGTVVVDTGQRNSKGRSTNDKLLGIMNAAAVYRAIDGYRRGNRQPMAKPIERRYDEERYRREEEEYRRDERPYYQAPNAAPNAMFQLPNKEEKEEEDNWNDEDNNTNSNDWMKF